MAPRSLAEHTTYLADIAPGIVERFEFELDTTKPVEMRQQVDENLAATTKKSRVEPVSPRPHRSTNR